MYDGWHSRDDEAESTERGDKAEVNIICDKVQRLFAASVYCP